MHGPERVRAAAGHTAQKAVTRRLEERRRCAIILPADAMAATETFEPPENFALVCPGEADCIRLREGAALRQRGWDENSA